mgnify:CR=1 FL=1
MSEKPEEPDFEALEEDLGLSPMDEEAMQMHELYKSLTRAGFRDKQALYLVAMIVNDMNEQAVIIHHVEDDEDEDDSDPGSAD